jgi:hypothetical protein
MAAGLRLTDGGDVIARQLRLPTTAPRVVAARAWSTTRGTGSLVQFLDAPTLPRKLRAVGAKVVPSPAFMRAYTPLARRGRAGLAAAYLRRWVFMIGHVPALWRDYRSVASRAAGDLGLPRDERAGGNRSNSE